MPEFWPFRLHHTRWSGTLLPLPCRAFSIAHGTALSDDRLSPTWDKARSFRIVLFLFYQKRVLVPLQFIMFDTFGFAYLIHRFVEQFDDMKPIKRNLGRRK